MSSTPWHDPAAPDPFSAWHGVHARVAHLLRHPDDPAFVGELDALCEVILQTVDAAPEASLFEMIYGEEIAGYAIAIPVGILIGLSQRLYQAINPLIQLFKPVSPLAWLPSFSRAW